jgi:DNA-binding response OmpR family regulator
VINAQERPSSNQRILCVEDDLDTCEFLAILLGEYSFQFAHTISSALPAVETEKHDLYILDNWLPDGSGIDLCRTIRQQYPTTPILFTSGSVKEDEIEEALEAGADQYLLKPCEPEQLKEIIKDLLFRN